jgi:flagellar basal-body rod modification protein FlgD
MTVSPVAPFGSPSYPPGTSGTTATAGAAAAGVAGTTGTGASTTASTGASTTSQLDKDMFLKLMVAQLRNQDPMNPQDSSEFLAQTAQFTSLEKLEVMAEQTTQSLAAQMAFGASSLAGRSVSYLGRDGVEATGVVATVRFTTTGPVLSVDGTDVPIADVVTVQA